MKIVITSATKSEWIPIQNKINQSANEKSNDYAVTFHTSGIGLLISTFTLTNLFSQLQPDLVIQAGIAGCFDTTIPLGTVLAIENEFLGDTGVVENNMFKDVFDLNLCGEDDFPFTKRRLNNPWLSTFNRTNLGLATSVTINEISTEPARIEQLKQKYDCTVESMEGAALHYVGLQATTPFIQIRAISNYIGDRDKNEWRIKFALENLAEEVSKLCLLLAEKNRNRL